MFIPILQKCILDGLERSFHPFKDIIPENKTKQVDDVNLHCFTISINGLLEYSNMSIWISVFDIG
jgi:Tat protein secretion system quality control protein TatD with DNase activity